MNRLERNLTRFYTEQNMDPAMLENILSKTKELQEEQACSGQDKAPGGMNNHQLSCDNGVRNGGVGTSKLSWFSSGVISRLFSNRRTTVSGPKRQPERSLPVAESDSGAMPYFFYRSWIPKAATALLLAGVATLVWTLVGPASNDAGVEGRYANLSNTGVPSYGDLQTLVLQEASLNHLSKLELEFNTDQLATLAASMSKLDFTLSLPHSLAARVNSGVELLGGRYCTIAGQLAAHVKFKSSDGELLSLFMTADDASLATIGDTSQRLNKRVEISTWREESMVYVLASAGSPLAIEQ